MTKDEPPQKEVVLLQPEGLAKAQLELMRSHKGGFKTKAYGPKGGEKHSAVQIDPVKP